MQIGRVVAEEERDGAGVAQPEPAGLAGRPRCRRRRAPCCVAARCRAEPKADRAGGGAGGQSDVGTGHLLKRGGEIQHRSTERPWDAAGLGRARSVPSLVPSAPIDGPGTGWLVEIPVGRQAVAEGGSAMAMPAERSIKAPNRSARSTTPAQPDPSS